MSRHFIILPFLFLTSPALAHGGHLGELAGHGHLVGWGLMAAAGLAAAAIARFGKKQDELSDEEPLDDAEGEPEAA